MGIHMEWANAAHTSHTVVTKGFDVREWDYLPEDERDDETTVDQPVAVVLSNDDAYVLMGSAIKIRALLRAIDADLEPHVVKEAAEAAQETARQAEFQRVVSNFVETHGEQNALRAASLLAIPEEIARAIEAEVQRRKEAGEISDLLKPIGH